MSSPSSRRGSIAARPARAGSRSRPCVVPVVTTGLHCGSQPMTTFHVASVVVPVVTTGLHCGIKAGQALDANTEVVPVVTTGLHCGDTETTGVDPLHDRMSSPSSRRGSIAAHTSRLISILPESGRPRRHDGAPLRPRAPGGLTRYVSRGRPRRHDGAPLRRGSPKGGGSQARPVVPVVTTGLHCGGSITRMTASKAFVVPVVTTGLHCGHVRHSSGA